MALTVATERLCRGDFRGFSGSDEPILISEYYISKTPHILRLPPPLPSYA